MTDLLSRLSSATGPSRELDAEIALAFGVYEYRACQFVAKSGGPWEQPPRYTESIDAALTLLEDGMVYRFECINPRPLVMAIVARPPAKLVAFPLHCRWHAAHTTLAIALLIAIEKAKEVSK